MDAFQKFSQGIDFLRSKTLFDGNITWLQCVQVLIAFVIIILVAKMIKGVFKFIVLVVLCVALVYSLNKNGTSKLEDLTAVTDNSSLHTIQEITKLSSNVKLEDNDIAIKVGDDSWVRMSDISSFVVIDGDKVSLSVQGNDILITDDEVVRLLELFKKK